LIAASFLYLVGLIKLIADHFPVVCAKLSRNAHHEGEMHIVQRAVLYLFFLVPLWSAASAIPPRAEVRQALHSPQPAPVRPVADVYYGTKVVDPYRYMENLADPEVQAWIKAQNDYTQAVLAGLPGREKLLKRITDLDQSVPDVARVQRLPGDVYLYSMLRAGEDTYKLYIRLGLKGKETLLVDPDAVAIAEASREKGKNKIGVFVPSNDLKYVAVTIMPGGAEDDTEIHVFETASGRETGDVVRRCCIKSDPEWFPGNRSFTYGRLQDLPSNAPSSEVRQKYRAYIHVLGSDPRKDPLVFGDGVVPSVAVDPHLYPAIRVQPDSKYALGVIGSPVAQPNSAFYIAPVDTVGKADTPWRKIADLSDDVAQIAVHGDDLYLLTYKNCPRYKIIRLDARNPSLGAAETVVPAGETIIQHIAAAQDALYVHVLDGGIGRILRVPYTHGARAEKVPIPFDGNASLFGIDPRVDGALLLVNSWTRAYKIDA
jgi:prolyl oligopeptidase